MTFGGDRMQVRDLFKEKYMAFKFRNGCVLFWNEHALGYTNNYKDAGVFTKQEVAEYYCLRILTAKEISTGEYRKLEHFALSMNDAAKFFF